MMTWVAALLLWSAAALAAGGFPVTTVKVERGAIEDLTRVQAVIEPIHAPQIKSKVSGEVVEILVDEGDRVQRGQVLARLDDELFRLDRDAARADIARLQALLDNQLLTLKRDESLFRQKLIPDTKLDASRLAVKQTRASIVHARALLDKAQYQLSHAVITAPVSGVVQQRNVSLGDYVDPRSPGSKPLFQIVSLDRLRARLLFPQSLAQRLRTGMPVTLIGADNRLRGRIDQIRPMLEAGNRALQALVDFDNRPGWKPGESLSAEVLLERHESVLLLPQAALVQRPAGLVVYRIVDGRAVETPVRTGIRQQGRVELLEGPAEGEAVALDGAPWLTDGTQVLIDNRRSGGAAR
jgi:RND family efflux transporter MFP subunit